MHHNDRETGDVAYEVTLILVVVGFLFFAVLIALHG